MLFTNVLFVFSLTFLAPGALGQPTHANRYDVAASEINAKDLDYHTYLPILMSSRNHTYYVATTGNDNNPGSFSQPWRTIQKAANTVAAGATTLSGKL